MNWHEKVLNRQEEVMNWNEAFLARQEAVLNRQEAVLVRQQEVGVRQVAIAALCVWGLGCWAGGRRGDGGGLRRRQLVALGRGDVIRLRSLSEI